MRIFAGRGLRFLGAEGRNDEMPTCTRADVSATYGELAEEQANELERHMAACPECAGEHEQLLWSLKRC